MSQDVTYPSLLLTLESVHYFYFRLNCLQWQKLKIERTERRTQLTVKQRS